MKVITIVGTRPEAIKLAPVIKELKNHSGEIVSLVCATAQHRELLDQVFEVFDLSPDFDLNVMQPSQSLSELTARLLAPLEKLLSLEEPDWVLVQGDTTTAMVSSLVASYHKVKLGHVEAGLRTKDKSQPFPEEMNRRIADLLADLHFTPTEQNRENLLAEGVSPNRIVVTGNTVIDSLFTVVDRLNREQNSQQRSASGQRLILVTVHRRESFGEPLKEICEALAEIAKRYRSEVQIVCPVHPNPNVWDTVHETLSSAANVTLTKPMDYYEFVRTMRSASLILTDSGGVQEEAPSLGIPVLVLREVTERPEGVGAGAVKVIGTSKHRIVAETAKLLDDVNAYQQMAQAVNPYGDGLASQRIVSALLGEQVEQFVGTLNGAAGLAERAKRGGHRTRIR